MRYDKLEGNRRTGLDVPRLDGGWNTRDEAGMIEDSQLAACSNLWWKEEALRTRPGIGCGRRPNRRRTPMSRYSNTPVRTAARSTGGGS